MKELISVEDYLIHRKGKEETIIHAEVVSKWYGDERVIRIPNYRSCFSSIIPIESWAKFKDMVDRMIVRFEALEKS